MYLKKVDGPRTVTMLDGTTMSRADLPEPGTRRWVASRKARVVHAVQSGLIRQEEAQKTYDISREEFEQWLGAVIEHGVGALKTTALQKYRQP